MTPTSATRSRSSILALLPLFSPCTRPDMAISSGAGEPRLDLLELRQRALRAAAEACEPGCRAREREHVARRATVEHAERERAAEDVARPGRVERLDAQRRHLVHLTAEERQRALLAPGHDGHAGRRSEAAQRRGAVFTRD